jgi:hypothetical protein
MRLSAESRYATFAEVSCRTKKQGHTRPTGSGFSDDLQGDAVIFGCRPFCGQSHGQSIFITREFQFAGRIWKRDASDFALVIRRAARLAPVASAEAFRKWRRENGVFMW